MQRGSALPDVEAAAVAPLVARIEALKQARHAVVLAHNYMSPDIFHTVADITGDSLALARAAAETDADVVVMAGVRFMAETAKLLSPDKVVLLPDLRAGCSLAASITPADVRALRARHPGVPVVAYVNTTAAVKAEVDVCCTSANAVEVVESFGADEVVLLPDRHLTAWVASQTSVRVHGWDGACEVHDRFRGVDLAALRAEDPELLILAHPECPPDVIAEADGTTSTSGMARIVATRRPARVALITECSMADNLRALHPDIDFVPACNLCPHMKRITLAGILDALEQDRHRIEIDPEVAEPARASIERMLALPVG